MNGTAATSDHRITRRARSDPRAVRRGIRQCRSKQVERHGRARLANREALLGQQQRRERHEAVRRDRAQHDGEIEQRERHGRGPQRRSNVDRSCAGGNGISGTCRSVNDSATRPGIMISGDHGRPMSAMNGANRTGAAREAERAARQVRRHREALAVIGELVDQRRGRRMKRGPAESAHHEDRAQHERRGRQPDKAEDDDRDQRARHHQHSWPPAIGERAETQLRHRIGHLETHRQRARRLQRQAELRDQQRQQRRVDVRIGVDDDVRGRDLPDRRMKAEPAAVPQPAILLKRPRMRSRASPNSRIRRSCAAAASVASDARW